LSESRTGEETLVDTAKVQQRLDKRRDNPYSRLEGSCHVPIDASSGLKKSHIKSTAGTFLEAMDKRGYTLASQLKLFGPYEAVEMDTTKPLPDMEEWRVRGVFKKDKPEFQRVYIDPDMVKQDPEHSITADKL